MAFGLGEQPVHDVLMVTEVRLFEPVEVLRQIDEAPPCGPLQNAERSCSLQSFVKRDLRASALVDQNEVGMYLGETPRFFSVTFILVHSGFICLRRRRTRRARLEQVARALSLRPASTAR
jgi:hypothetical protein